MCTHVTEHRDAVGSGKGPNGWFSLSTMTVYFDHPAHAPADHTLNVDFADRDHGGGSRVAVELSARTAVELVSAVARVLADVPRDLTSVEPELARRVADATRSLAATVSGETTAAGTKDGA